MHVPLRFEPFLRPMVWGGRRLGDRMGKALPSGEKYGESWEVSDHALHNSVVAAGPARGRSLRDLMERERAELLGPSQAGRAQFPWLVKFLDACDWLSVQVHPDEEAVKRLWPGEGSKTEAWFVVAADPGSRIYAGLRPGVDESRLRQALAEGTVADCMHSFSPRPGDCVFLPAGTIHAVGGGVLIAEMQQTSDATFRLFDWNRRDAQGKARTLHIEESLASIHWEKGPVQPIHVAGFTDSADSVRSEVRQPLLRCPYFIMEYVQSREPIACGGEGRLQLLVALRGQGTWGPAEGAEEVRTGAAWLLPAGMPRIECRPRKGLGALLCTLP